MDDANQINNNYLFMALLIVTEMPARPFDLFAVPVVNIALDWNMLLGHFVFIKFEFSVK